MQQQLTSEGCRLQCMASMLLACRTPGEGCGQGVEKCSLIGTQTGVTVALVRWYTSLYESASASMYLHAHH